MADSDLVHALLDRVVAFDAPGVHAAVRDFVRLHGVPLTVTRLLSAAQQEVGRRWEFGEWTVTEEHAATAMIDEALGVMSATDAAPVDGPSLAVVCAEGEWHVTPARMAALLFRHRGWRVTMLGGSTPARHLARGLAHLRPDVVAVSCTLPTNLAGARRTIGVAHDLGLPAVVGGAAVHQRPQRAASLGADAGGVLFDRAEHQARSWIDDPPVLRPAAPGHIEEVRRLRQDRARVVKEAYADVAAAVPDLATASDHHVERTYEDLSYILEFLEAALDVDDPTLFTEFVGWLTGLLAVRGVPARAVAISLEALAVHLEPSLRASADLLETAMRRI